MANSIAKLLEPQAVRLHMDYATSKDVIKSLGALLYQAGHVRPTFIIGALEREKTLPTGLPLGGTINAAIPHTDIHHVIHAAVALATLNKPVIFKNMVNSEEEVPVRIVFLLALKEAHAQIEMLQEIAGILQNESVINDLMKANSNKEVLAILEKA